MKNNNNKFDENDEKLIEMIGNMSNVLADNGEEDTDMLDILLDSDNDSFITMFDENNSQIKFQQVATIPFNENVYAILKPIDYLEGVEDDEALVFKIIQELNGSSLELENDKRTCQTIFDKYYELITDPENN